MARVIRDCWVYRPLPRYRNLPMKQDEHQIPFDYDANDATPDKFPYQLDKPPKLWVAWLYSPKTEFQKSHIQQKVHLLFGKDWQLGKMKVFKNTADINRQLWDIKHLIEMKPVTFPQGEPTADHVTTMHVDHEGNCLINPDTPRANDWAPKPRLTKKYMKSFNSAKWVRMTQPLFEDAVWTDPNISRAN